MYIEASVRGYHAYFKDATICVGEIMMCEIKGNNDHDKYAVVVKKMKQER